MPECICPRECDCESPEPKNGVALVSELCPVHNVLYGSTDIPHPTPHPECLAERHWWQE